MIYVNQNGAEIGRFKPRKEAFYAKEQFPDILPALLEKGRLNYLYTKLYRTEYLKGIRVEPDVKQGSDTMINMQYALRINNIAVIEDYDYHHVCYTTRSVTSYKGTDYFWRLYRINKYLYDLMENRGLLNDKMQRAIDGRILYSGRLALIRTAHLNVNIKNKLAVAHKTIYCDEYLCSYNRLKENGQLETISVNVIHPGEEDAFILQMHKKDRDLKKLYFKKRILKHMPKFIIKAYHHIKRTNCL